MTTRTLSGSLRNGDAPLAGITISFTLVDATTHAQVLAWQPATGERVTQSTQVVTDVNGEFSVQLTPNDSLSPATTYLCQTHGLNDKFYAPLASGNAPERWIDFYAGGVPLTPAELSALQTHLADTLAHLSAEQRALLAELADLPSLLTYQHHQTIAATTWVINHNLGHYPSITLLTIDSDEFIAEVNHVSVNQTTVHLVIPFTGIAQCN